MYKLFFENRYLKKRNFLDTKSVKRMQKDAEYLLLDIDHNCKNGGPKSKIVEKVTTGGGIALIEARHKFKSMKMLALITFWCQISVKTT